MKIKEFGKRNFTLISLSTLTLLLVLLSFSTGSAFSDLRIIVNGQKVSSEETPLDNLLDLPSIGSYENLKVLLQEAEPSFGYHYREQLGALRAGAAVQSADAVPEARKEMANVANENSFSDTNVQVEGVDEADIVKTDGQYIYQANEREIVVVKAYPPEEMKVHKTIQWSDPFNPRELYLDEQYLVVIGTVAAESNFYYPDRPEVTPKRWGPEIYPPPVYYPPVVKAKVYNIKDKENFTLQREIELEGDYVSSRKIGSALYLVSDRRLDWVRIQQQPEKPFYRDSAAAAEGVSVDYADIKYFPGCVQPSYLMVAGLDLAQPQAEIKVSTYLGSAENVYVSPENLYVAATKNQVVPLNSAPIHYAPETQVFKFALQKGAVQFTGKTAVPGRILNQFSMDEDQGYFRIATTSGDIWRNDAYTSQNNVYVLDNKLNLVGRLENIAPGEKIYATRFIGNRIYMVTFKTTDPFFVIDLSDPKQPAVLGALKIPGYSDYLHPYDENHIIGFGKEAVEVIEKDPQGREVGRSAYYQGMKIALFDVRDVHNPVQLFTETIGDRGTDSELLRNHKALLFDREKNLLAFPVTVMEVKNQPTNNERRAATQFGSFTFQGAYLYHLDLTQGFTLQTRITHLSPEDYLKAGSRWYRSDKNVERILYINDAIYTLSPKFIQAHDLRDFHLRGNLEVPY
ncbi:MAG: hypothetical protein GX295_08000 [Syntrophomonadaceae bacterium]|nr:hypothetical protein [Syntrophomonadaceae bacterium]